MQEYLDGAKELAKIEELLMHEGVFGSKLDISMKVLRQLQVMKYEYKQRLTPYVYVDRTHQSRPIDNGNYDGHIPQCSVARCNFACCDVGNSGANTIKMAKDELKHTKLSTSHLTIIEDLGDQGCRTTCNNGCNGGKGCGPDPTRENASGYKPYDCDDYPWFRNLNRGQMEFWISDTKCPLSSTAKLTHLPGVFDHFNKIMKDPSMVPSYENAIENMVNYKFFDPDDLEMLDPDDLENIFSAGVHLALDKEKKTISVLTDESPENAILEYEKELRKKAQQALEIVRRHDGIRYSHLQY